MPKVVRVQRRLVVGAVVLTASVIASVALWPRGSEGKTLPYMGTAKSPGDVIVTVGGSARSSRHASPRQR